MDHYYLCEVYTKKVYPESISRKFNPKPPMSSGKNSYESSKSSSFWKKTKDFAKVNSPSRPQMPDTMPCVEELENIYLERARINKENMEKENMNKENYIKSVYPNINTNESLIETFSTNKNIIKSRINNVYDLRETSFPQEPSFPAAQRPPMSGTQCHESLVEKQARISSDRKDKLLKIISENARKKRVQDYLDNYIDKDFMNLSKYMDEEVLKQFYLDLVEKIKMEMSKEVYIFIIKLIIHKLIESVLTNSMFPIDTLPPELKDMIINHMDLMTWMNFMLAQKASIYISTESIKKFTDDVVDNFSDNFSSNFSGNLYDIEVENIYGDSSDTLGTSSSCGDSESETDSIYYD